MELVSSDNSTNTGSNHNDSFPNVGGCDVQEKPTTIGKSENTKPSAGTISTSTSSNDDTDPISRDDDNNKNNKEELLPRVFLLIENPKKSNNWGPILRCAAAFGIPQIIAVGYDKCAVQGSHGASKHVELIAFPTHNQAIEFLRTTCHCTCFLGLLGGQPNAYNNEGYTVRMDETTGIVDLMTATDVVSDDNDQDSSSSSYNNNKTSSSPPAAAEAINFPKSFPVHVNPFFRKNKASSSSSSSSSYLPEGRRPVGVGNLCIIFGKKSKGLVSSLAEHCDSFCHIPHVGMDDNNDDDNDDDDHNNNEKKDKGQQQQQQQFALLNLESCLSIVLHQFMAWSGYDDADQDGSGGGAIYTGQKYNVERIQKGSLVLGGGGSSSKSLSSSRRMEYKLRLKQEEEELEASGSILGGGGGMGGSGGSISLFGGSNDNNDGDY